MSVVATLGVIKKYFQGKSGADVSTTILKLHRWTAIFLVACSILTTSKQFFGEPIHCMLGGGSIPLAVFQSYCFMSGTYTLPIISSNITEIHPGVSTGYVHAGAKEDGTLYHNYYQWVCLLLAAQACVCYLPWAFWKCIENGIVGKLIAKVSVDPLTEVSLSDQVSGLGDFLLDHKGWFNSKAIKLILCQLACLILTIAQMYFMDLVLGGQFLSLGNDIHQYEVFLQSLNKVFPKVVKCSMAYIGPSGEVVNNSGMCTLPVNIINEKIYLTLWIWFIFLVVVSLFCLALQFMLLLFPCVRRHVLLQCNATTTPGNLQDVAKYLNYGDAVLLQLIGKNIDSVQFKALLCHISDANSLPSYHVNYSDTTGFVMNREMSKRNEMNHIK